MLIKDNSPYHTIYTFYNPRESSCKTTFQNIFIASSVGENGVIHASQKREGDLKTPLGCHRILYGMYRADKIAAPSSLLPMIPIQPHWGWCDDPLDRNYNTLIELPSHTSYEKLWRDDNLYNIVLVTDFNMTTSSHYTKPHYGSAIFIHVEEMKNIKESQKPSGDLPSSSSSSSPIVCLSSSAGCLKLLEDDLRMILKRCGDSLYWQIDLVS